MTPAHTQEIPRVTMRKGHIVEKFDAKLWARQKHKKVN